MFITGTDTGVGKTVVAAAVLRRMRTRVDAVPMKPVQTGAVPAGGGLRAPDLEFCLKAAALEPGPTERKLMAPYLYEPACSPHLAAGMCGRYPDIPHMAACAERLLEAHAALVVEGAGGVMVPLDESHTMLHLMQALGLPVLLVARRGLGTLNHSLLSLAALRGAGLDVAGIVFNEAAEAPHDFIRADNPGTVARFGDVALIGNIGYVAGLRVGSDSAWERVARDMPGLPRLLEALEGP
ncbi:MAG: dethiobiotin synthase [Planctomycetota bacterium]